MVVKMGVCHLGCHIRNDRRAVEDGTAPPASCQLTVIDDSLVHIANDCVCSATPEGFLFALLEQAREFTVLLQDIDAGLFTVQCTLPPLHCLADMEQVMADKASTVQMFVHLERFYRCAREATGFWPDLAYFGDFILLKSGDYDLKIKFLRPTKFTTFKKYLIGVRSMFLDLCHSSARRMVALYGAQWLTIETGKGVNAKHCHLSTFTKRPPPCINTYKDAMCRPPNARTSDGCCPHAPLLARFKETGRVAWGADDDDDEKETRLPLACPRTLDSYAQAGVRFECRLFPEARAFFAELKRCDRLHTVFCYPDELLDAFWYNDFMTLVNEFKMALVAVAAAAAVPAPPPISLN